MGRAGPFQNGRAGVEGSAGGKDIVEQQQAGAADEIRLGNDERTGDIGAPLRMRESRLRARELAASQERTDGDSGAGAEFAGEQKTLVEAAQVALPPMERHGDDGVEADVAGHRGGQQAAERFGQRADAAVLKEMDQLAERALISAEAIGGVEAVRAESAKGADAVVVEGPRIGERSTAAGAKELGREDFGFGEATGADRDAREFSEGIAADLAVRRE